MAGGGLGGAIGGTVWLTGLSGSGKSTIAGHLRSLLDRDGVPALVLDGDELREGLNADLGFGEADRAENVRRVGEVALLFARHGFVVLVPVISPYAAGRAAVRARHDRLATPYVEVHVATPLEVCEARDPKGLYVKARAGLIERFTGISDPYEPPPSPEVRLDTDGTEPGALAAGLLERLRRLVPALASGD
ncbi:MAG: adenylyl-sulfate kinase [Actinomycetota bacterium]|nr:adenylyl-sulfate kinase [Actinomycetota bacterium]